MKKELRVELIAHLQRALQSKTGISLSYLTNEDALRARQKFYIVRREHPEYQSLSFIDKGSDLWIINGAET